MYRCWDNCTATSCMTAEWLHLSRWHYASEQSRPVHETGEKAKVRLVSAGNNHCLFEEGKVVVSLWRNCSRGSEICGQVWRREGRGSISSSNCATSFMNVPILWTLRSSGKVHIIQNLILTDSYNFCITLIVNKRCIMHHQNSQTTCGEITHKLQLYCSKSNMAIANLRPPDAMPVPFRCDYDAMTDLKSLNLSIALL